MSDSPRNGLIPLEMSDLQRTR